MEVDYDPCLEIDPSKFLLVVGPQFTAAVLKEITNEAVAQSKLALTSRQLVTVGIHLLLETEEFQTDAERAKCDTLYRNAYELDPLFAVKKLSSSLQKYGKYAEWLQRAFGVDLVPSSESPSLEKVRHLQQEGALVVYTHYDDVLCRVSKTKPVLLNDPSNFERWCRGEIEGILHVHGVYSELDTVVFDSDAYHTPGHQFQTAASQLGAVFGARHMLMIGFDMEKHSEDPLLTKFVERFTAESPPNLHTIHLTRAENPIELNCVHKIAVLPDQATPVSSLLPLSSTSQAMWRQIELPHASPNSLTLSLLCGKKEEANEISSMIADSPGVTFAVVSSFIHNSQLTHTVSLRVLKSKEKELWDWLVHQQRVQLLTKGLLAVVLHSGTFFWLRGKPYSGSEGCLVDAFPPPLIHATQTSHTGNTDSFSPFKPKEEAHSPDYNFPKSATRKVPRYTMHQIRPRHQPYPGAGPTLGKHGRSELPAYGQHNARALHERRASLPVNSIRGSSSQALDQLAHNLSPAQSHELPSYAAIKQALLCDWYKRRRSIQADPKTLKFLLKSKLITEPLDLLKLRRYSDPGSYISQPESFARRKELFIDENRTWSYTYGKVIEEKIEKWKQQREERRRREMLELTGLKYHLLNPLQSSGIPSSNAHMFPSGLATAGLNSYVYPSTIIAPASGAMQGQPQSSMLYSPYIAPYTVVNPYQSFVQVGQPTTLYVPQPATLPSQQKLVYLVPPNTVSTAPSYPSLNGTTQHLKVGGTMLTRKKSDSNLRDTDEQQQLRDMYKRRQSVPVNLSSLLVSPLSQFEPDSPPPTKRIHLSEEPPLIHTTPPISHSTSPQQSHSQLSSRQHHLLQVHRTSHQRNGETGHCRSASHSPVPSPQSVGQSSNYSPTHYHNGNYFDSDGSELDETEAEKIVGGAVLSSSQPGLGGPAPHSQLQLWQFLLELLLISANTRLIQWSNNNFEFQINNPSGVAELWGKVTNNDSMNYSQLLKGLRYYFNKGIMSRVEGKRDSFRYNSCIQSYIETRRSSIATNQEEMVVVE